MGRCDRLCVVWFLWCVVFVWWCLADLGLEVLLCAVEECVECVAGVVVFAESAVDEWGEGLVMFARDGVLVKLVEDAL